ncbi:MAG: DUF4433 domain-containing protein [Bacteroides sp.]|nr:DUF4433 domain-containing protein [Bacteroides sp.]
MFRWLKNLFAKLGGKTIMPTQKKYGQNNNETDAEFDRKVQEVIREKGRITASKTEWFKITIHNPEPAKKINIFEGYQIETDTLSGIKERRIEKEQARIKAAENSVRYKLGQAKVHIQTESANAASVALSSAYSILKDLKNEILWDDYRQLHRDLSTLRDTLRNREIERQEAERIAREEQERRRREEEAERQKRFLAEQRRIAAERAREIRRFEAQLKTKEEKERQEKNKLEKLTSSRKDDALEIKQLLESNHIYSFYHFTSRLNLQSIKSNGGLFSWKYCEKNNITIPVSGGDQQSRALDSLHNLEDYVRLSFCDDHPMAYRLRDKDLVLLKIDIDVAMLKGTLFSDINAAALNHHHGGTLNDLKKVDFSAVKRHYVSRNDEDFASHQAEILVKTFVPIKYITNIDNSIELYFS